MSNAKEVSSADFQREVLESDVPVLVDFWAPWCGPCRMIAPMVDQVAINYDGRAKVVKVDIDQNQDIARNYHVRAIPTLLLFKGGQVQGTQVGAATMAALAKMIEQNL